MAAAVAATSSDYPAWLDITPPERLDRLSTLLRLLYIIPAIILSSLVTGAAQNLGLAVVLMLLFRQKYPRVWFDWALYLNQYSTRVSAYVLLLTDRYPSTTDMQDVDVRADLSPSLNRFLPLVKWLLAIPHFIVLMFLGLVLVIVTVIAWFAILFTGRYPRGMFDYAVGVLRWQWRVNAYFLLLSTDRYPPFALR